MKKRVEFKLISILEINFLVLSIVAFSFILSQSQLVKADGILGIGSKTSSVKAPGLSIDRVIENDGVKTTFKQSFQGGKLSYFIDGKEATYEQASAFAKVHTIDISESAKFALQNSLSSSSTQLGSLSAGQSLGNGVSVISNTVGSDGKVVSVLQDAAGGTQTVTGEATDSLGETIKTANTPAESGGFLDKIFGLTPLGIQGVAGHLVSGLIWGAVAFGAVKLIGGFLGLNEKTTNAAAIAAFGGVASFRVFQLDL